MTDRRFDLSRYIPDIFKKKSKVKSGDRAKVDLAASEVGEKSPITKRAAKRLEEIASELVAHGLPYDLALLKNVGVEVINQGASVNIEGDKVTLSVSQSKVDSDPSCLDHEPAHVIHYQLRGEEKQTKDIDQGEGDRPTFDQVKTLMSMQGASEMYAFLFEELFNSTQQVSTFQKHRAEQKIDSPDDKFPAFEMYYTSPRHALGQEAAQRFLERIPDRESRIKAVVSLMNQPAEVVWQYMEKLLGDDFPELMERFDKATRSYYREYYE